MGAAFFHGSRGSAENGSLSRAAFDLLSSLPQPVLVLDGELHVTGWNESAAFCFGLTEATAAGKRIGEVVASQGLSEVLEAGDSAKVLEHRAPDGRIHSFSWRKQAVVGESGAISGWLCLASPAAPRKGQSIEERILAVVLDNIPLSVWAVDQEGTYVFHDGLGVEVVGVQRRAFLGRNLWELWKNVPGTDETRRQVRVAMEKGEPTHAFAEAMDRHWESWCMPARNEAGEVDTVVCVTLDVTATKSIENELRAKLEVVERQQQIIHELATPILQVWEGVLAVPLVGVVDSARTADVMNDLLGRVTSLAARHVILDLTGVDMVDTRTAAYLIDLVRAIRLLGAEAIITGIRPSVAQTIISVGVDLSGIPTRSNLRSGLEYCMKTVEGRAIAPRKPTKG